MVTALAPIRERAADLRAHPGRVDEILRDGAARARALAGQTMTIVRERMGFLKAGGQQRER